MAEGKELKLNEEAFNNTVLKIMEYKNALVGAMESYISDNNNMKKDWIGDGGTAFTLSSNVVEEKFRERINDIDMIINDLNSTSFSMFELDKFLGKAITGAIFGQGVLAVLEVADTTNALVNGSSNK